MNRSASGFSAFHVGRPGVTLPWRRTGRGPRAEGLDLPQSWRQIGSQSGFAVSQAGMLAAVELAGAGGTLIGVTLACAVVGAALGWALGATGIGLLVGIFVGIPLGIFAVYRRYRGVIG